MQDDLPPFFIKCKQDRLTFENMLDDYLSYFNIEGDFGWLRGHSIDGAFDSLELFSGFGSEDKTATEEDYLTLWRAFCERSDVLEDAPEGDLENVSFAPFLCIYHTAGSIARGDQGPKALQSYLQGMERCADRYIAEGGNPQSLIYRRLLKEKDELASRFAAAGAALEPAPDAGDPVNQSAQTQCEACNSPLGPDDIQCEACGEYDRRAIRHLTKVCDQDPHEGLRQIGLLSDAQLRVNGVALAHFFALARVSAEAIGADRLNTVISCSPSELRDLVDIAHEGYAERAALEIEQMDEEFIQGLSADAKKHIDTQIDIVLTIMERFRPGYVQELLGWTKLRYFGPERIKFYTELDRTDVTTHKTLYNFANNVRLSPDMIGRTAIIMGSFGHDAVPFIYVVWMQNIFGSSDKYRDRGDLQIYENGKYTFEIVTMPEDKDDKVIGGLDHPDREHLLEEAHMLLEHVEDSRRRNFLLETIEWLEGRRAVAPVEAPDDLAATTKQPVGKRAAIALAAAAIVSVALLVVVGSHIGKSQQKLPPNVVAFPSPVTENLPSGSTALNVNERSGAGVSFPSVSVAMAGSAITEVGRATDQEGKPWLAIRRDDGSYAFIKERLVHPGSIATDTAAQDAAAASKAAAEASAAAVDAAQVAAAAARAKANPPVFAPANK